MTSRSVIFFSSFFALLCTLPAMAGTFTGSAMLAGGAAEHRRDSSGVVVWLEPLNASAAPAPSRERILQKGKAFLPHILAIPVGTTVDFPNLDPIYHNAFSNFNGQIFDIGLYPPGKSKSVVFGKPGIVRVFCNIHPSMSAVIVVIDTPYYAVTDRSGHYSIPNVPPGTYRRYVFHERATPETLNGLTSNVASGTADTTLPSLTISEAGYIPMPHPNKFGRPYPRNSEDDTYSIQ